jgi:hypothetical protein
MILEALRQKYAENIPTHQIGSEIAISEKVRHEM